MSDDRIQRMTGVILAMGGLAFFGLTSVMMFLENGATPEFMRGVSTLILLSGIVIALAPGDKDD